MCNAVDKITDPSCVVEKIWKPPENQRRMTRVDQTSLEERCVVS
jgi:hypothetical protein